MNNPGTQTGPARAPSLKAAPGQVKRLLGLRELQTGVLAQFAGYEKSRTVPQVQEDLLFLQMYPGSKIVFRLIAFIAGFGLLLLLSSCQTSPGVDALEQPETGKSIGCQAKPHSFFAAAEPSEYEWNVEGVSDPKEIQAWENCGFSPRFADVAKNLGLTPALVAPYINNGYSIDPNGSADQVNSLAAQINAAEAPAKQNSIDINDMYAAGVNTQEDAEKWVELLQKYPSSLPQIDYSYTDGPTELNGNITDSIRTLVGAGITPDQADKYLAAGLSFQDSSLVSEMVPFLVSGFSVSQANLYAQYGVPLNQASAFDYVLRRFCSFNVADGNKILSDSPYAINGHCYRMRSIDVSQWLGPKSALSSSNSIKVDFSEPPDGASVQNALVIGEPPFVYESTSSGMQTIPAVKVILVMNSSQ